MYASLMLRINSSPAGQNGRHFADDISRCIFLNEKFYVLIQISLKFVPKLTKNPALVYVMASRRICDKPLYELMLSQFTDAYMRHYGEMIFNDTRTHFF